MRTLIAIIGAVIAAVVIGVLLSYQPGYVLIAYGTMRIEFTLFVFLLIYVAALVIGALLWWLLRHRSLGAALSKLNAIRAGAGSS